MTLENHQIHKYQYEFHSQFSDDGVNDNSLVYLYDKEGMLQAVIAFLADGQVLQAPLETSDGYVTVQMHRKQMPSIIDMLRNESPLMFSWLPSTRVMRLSTHMEPVGEQELKRLFSFLYI